MIDDKREFKSKLETNITNMKSKYTNATEESLYLYSLWITSQSSSEYAICDKMMKDFMSGKIK